MLRTMTAAVALATIGWLLPLSAGGASQDDFQPDPISVRRHGPAYRYPQAGWIVLHIEGEPYVRGYQHGRLLAPEIAAYLRCFAALQSPKAPEEGWKVTRALINALFVRRYEREYLEEMKGIADGASAAGARFDKRPIDLVDIVGLNAWPEVETLNSALEATPTGLEGIRFPRLQPQAMPEPKPSHCSAFAATGPATADGKIVFGHITMFGLYPSLFFNVWLDVKPAKGHRVLIQSFPGGIQSGLDYYLNDAGLLVCETTIAQTRFDIQGMSLASRIRQVLQYADNIDQAVEILKKGNNGLYTNEWLLADVKTNEIAMFELGTAKSKLYRSSKNEWFGGTEGFYWGCNNTKDLDVRLETIPGVQGRPANLVWRPSERDKAWLKLFAKHKGKIDAAFGKEAFTTPPLAAYPSLDAKYTTTDLAKQLKTIALYGPPLGRTWQPTLEERRLYPEIRPMVSNPWTVLHTTPPASENGKRLLAVDLPERIDEEKKSAVAARDEDRRLPSVAAWHGTLLPKTDADAWLAAAFADYEKIVALEHALCDRHTDGLLTSADRDRLAVQLFAHRADYLAAARADVDVPLSKAHADVARDQWYHVAAGKGVWALHELRQLLGDKTFEEAMDSFGREHAGKEVSASQFLTHLEKVGERKGQILPRLHAFFDYWLTQKGLPTWQLGDVQVKENGKGFQVTGSVLRESASPFAGVEVTVETAKGERTKRVALPSDFDASQNHDPLKFVIETDKRPRWLILDKYGWTAKANGGAFSVLSFHSDLENTLIVAGTADEEAANREAAEALQRAVRERWTNFTLPIKTDREVTDDDLKTHHLLLIGRPDGNRIVARFRDALPVTFGSRSFVVRDEAYAHAGSAVIAAAENPLDRRFSLVLFAGLSAEATLHAPPVLLKRGQTAAEVLVLPHEGKPRALVMPARELVRELPEH